MFIEAGTALSLAEYTLEHDKALRKNFNKLRLWLKRGTLSIAVFGPGGTGKSTLGQYLIGKLPQGGNGSYRESLDIEVREVDGLGCHLLVAPGQPRRRKTHFPKLFADISSGKTTGIINVVSYGCHSFATELKSMPLFKAGMTSDDFMKSTLWIDEKKNSTF
jgi:energy-coupling factor transporter ATP-binding protein EcfA2